ncbi:MAG: hypothetical protein KBC84_03320 [Proteobacteria bacterium]|nr:hypothetical protein [Pseudomonadota bacterium]
MTKIIIIFTICTLLSTATVLLLFYFKSQSVKNKLLQINKGLDKETKNLLEMDEAITKAMQYVTEMRPLAEASERIGRVDEIKSDLAQENSKLKSLEEQMTAYQTKIDEFINGREDTRLLEERNKSIIQELIAKKKEMFENSLNVEKDLQQIESEIDNITKQSVVNEEQKEALLNVALSLANCQKQLVSIREKFETEASNFQNLENQYNDLQVEYKKLKEKGRIQPK